MNPHARLQIPPGRRGSAAIRIALLVIGIAVTVTTLETTLRLVTGTTLLSVEPVLVPRELVYAPNQRQRYKTPEWDIEIATNARGFRDAERPPSDTGGSVVVLGSSFVEGHGVRLEDTFVKRLERTLKARGRETWVYNAGFHGSNVLWQSRIYRDHFRAVPGVTTVILAICIPQDIGTAAPPIGIPPPPPHSYSWKVFLGENCALYNVLNRKVKSSTRLLRAFRGAGLTAGSDLLAAVPYDAALTRPLLDRGIAQIRELARDVKADGRAFQIVLLPMREQVSPAFFEELLADSRVPRAQVDLMGAHIRLRTELAAAGLAVYDATPALSQPAASVSDYFFHADRHYSPKGHEVVAAGLADLLAPAR